MEEHTFSLPAAEFRMTRLKERIGAHLELCKVRISLFSAFSAATGFVLAASGLRPEIVILSLGVFLLACGSSALNQYQEREIDARMPRTERRPIPSGRIIPLHALLFSAVLLFSGFAALLLTANAAAPLLGLVAVCWYNGVYTYLKRRSAFAVVPGALIGVVPPAIGWVTGGGSLSDPRLLVLCFFFFMWQVPHFWLLILDFGGEYEKAGLPSMTRIFSRPQLTRIIFIWISAAAVSCLFISMPGMVQIPHIRGMLFAASLWIIWYGVRLLKGRGGGTLSAVTFTRINVYMLLVMLLLTTDKILI
ncbi:MAG TPA: protoheme IX farnesyltransferase [Thermodesulfovibrionales bacterium]|nr:protoheme IX farnesyltransferase [Thermodesulfovibrionales bacterium]